MREGERGRDDRVSVAVTHALGRPGFLYPISNVHFAPIRAQFSQGRR
jgi:hypothetical protein